MYNLQVCLHHVFLATHTIHKCQRMNIIQGVISDGHIRPLFEGRPPEQAAVTGVIFLDVIWVEDQLVTVISHLCYYSVLYRINIFNLEDKRHYELRAPSRVDSER